MSVQEFDPDRLSFLTALIPLVPRMAAKDLESTDAFLDESSAPHSPNPGHVLWEPYFDLSAAIKDKGAKARPKSALKQPRSVARPQVRKYASPSPLL